MIALLLCILSNTGIFICFRLFKVFNLNTLQAIVFNYVTCVATGIIFLKDKLALNAVSWSTDWVIIGAILGAVFIGTFYLMARTTQIFSMTVSSIASKMSLMIPVLMSLFVLGIQSKHYSSLNYVGIALAILAILLSSLKGKKIETVHLPGLAIFLPIAVFLLSGLIDSVINFTNFKYLSPETEPVFPIIIFSSASIIGLASIMVGKNRIAFKNVIWGVVLGVVNYFSIFFLLRSLSYFKNDGAIFYPLLNVGIILFASLVSVIFFKEKLSRINLLGLILAISSIVLISYQELKLIFE
ncbi:hypothetical protein [Fulvivirga sp.]|uniref:hypothetical protein n=1 Tax=Fulvivirga sp. TaxID=1931237 RepID=UPI0032EB60B8